MVELHGLEMFETVTMDNARKWYPQLLPTLKLIGDGFSNIADGYRKPDVSPVSRQIVQPFDRSRTYVDFFGWYMTIRPYQYM